MQHEKTVLEWLEQAKADGHEWADEALSNVLERKKSKIYESLPGALLAAFDFENSPQGFRYWSNIYRNLRAQQ